jgi:hypothetical protein
MSEIEKESLPDPIRQAFDTLAALTEGGRVNMTHTVFTGKASVNIFHPSRLIETEGVWERTVIRVDPESGLISIGGDVEDLIELQVYEE